MALGIQSHVSGLSASNTVELLGVLGVQRSRKAIHDWVQKANLQPASGKTPNQVAVDETVIRINDQQLSSINNLLQKSVIIVQSGESVPPLPNVNHS